MPSSRGRTRTPAIASRTRQRSPTGRGPRKPDGRSPRRVIVRLSQRDWRVPRGRNAPVTDIAQSYRTARRVALASLGVSGLLSCSNIVVGLRSHSTSAVAMGFEFAGDALASSVVLVGMGVAARPADDNHPYGHGRMETLSAFIVGMILAAGGVMICYQ